MTPAPDLRKPRSGRDTTLIHGCSLAALKAISAVPSTEPSSTITHSEGRTCWDTTDEIVRCKNSASLRTGVTTTSVGDGFIYLSMDLSSGCHIRCQRVNQSQVFLLPGSPIVFSHVLCGLIDELSSCVSIRQHVNYCIS